MTSSSYQTLARYDDDCTRKCRARNLDDIRVRQREVLKQSRMQSKCLKIILNRRTLLKTFVPTYDFEERVDVSNQLSESSSDQTNYSSPPRGWGVSSSDWGSPTSSQPDSLSSSLRCTPSPSGSLHSDHSTLSLNSDIDTDYIPDYLLQIQPAQSRNRHKNQVNNQARSELFKGSTLKTSPRHLFNEEKLLVEFKTLKYLIQLASCDINQINHLLCYKWSIIIYSMQSDDTELVKESISLIISLLSKNLILPEIILHMLQNGLIFNLRNLYERVGLHMVTRVLLAISQSAPQVIPYMTELMVNSKMLSDFQNSILYRTDLEVMEILKLFNFITLTLHQNAEKLDPLMPEILRRTGVSHITHQSYTPTSTLLKLIRPELIGSIIEKCFKLLEFDDSNELVRTGMNLLAFTLELMRSLDTSNQKAHEWMVRVLTQFKISELSREGLPEDLLMRSTSSHQIVKHQFIMYFRTHFDQLMTQYKHNITEEQENIALQARNSHW